MSQEQQIKLFEDRKVRTVWDSKQEKWYFSIVDVISILMDSNDYQQARKYWKVLKGRLIQEGCEPVTNCYQLKMQAADGKMNLLTDDDLPNNAAAMLFSTNMRNYPQFRLRMARFPRTRINQDVTQDIPQYDTQNDTQGDTQDVHHDKWIECQMILRPKITTEELASMSQKGLRTIKRHISKMPHIKYVGHGFSGHWEVHNSKSIQSNPISPMHWSHRILEY